MVINAFCIVFGWLIVAYSQPDHPLPALLATLIGYALFFYGIRSVSSPKKKFFIGVGWFLAIQLIQLKWIATPYYHGVDIYYAYLAIAVWLALQWGFLTLFFKQEMGYYRILAMASFWVLSEYSRLFVLCGFPFNPIGQSLTFASYPLQLAGVMGILGLSFWALASNLFIYKWWVEPSLRTASVALVCAITPYLFGSWNIHVHKEGVELSEPFRVALVQTGLYAEEKTEFQEDPDPYLTPVKQWKQIIGLLEKRVNEHVDLIVLPEATVPSELFERHIPTNTIEILPKTEHSFASNGEVAQAIANHFQSELILGALYSPPLKERSYNSAVHFSPHRKMCQMYHKRVLVPLSEYLPFSFIRSMVAKHGIESFFTPGVESNLFYGKRVLSASICYEECFSHIVREGRVRGANFLVNLSNDVWFPHSRLSKEHFHLGRLRAVENGAPLVRACNTGITVGVDSLGRIIGKLEEKKDSAHWLQDVLYIDIPSYSYKTLFSRTGNSPVLAFSFFTLSTFLILRKKYRL
jgi:apolipoprotein N-acyltransferase